MKRFLAPLTVAGVALVAFLVSFAATAHAAQAVAPDDGSLLDLARPIFDQIMAGHYLASTALALVLAVALVKRYAPGKFGDFVHSDAGGALTTLLMAFGGALATATMGGAAWSWGMCWAALGIAVTAAGGYSLIKKLVVEPILRPLSKKTPAWMAPLWALMFWIFDRKSNEADTAATKAGADAVAAKPAAGVDGVAGEPRDL